MYKREVKFRKVNDQPTFPEQTNPNCYKQSNCRLYQTESWFHIFRQADICQGTDSAGYTAWLVPWTRYPP